MMMIIMVIIDHCTRTNCVDFRSLAKSISLATMMLMMVVIILMILMIMAVIMTIMVMIMMIIMIMMIMTMQQTKYCRLPLFGKIN